MFRDNHGKSQGSVIVEEYSGLMGCTDEEDRVDISYSVCWGNGIGQTFSSPISYYVE
jgi:hypothetical protein